MLSPKKLRYFMRIAQAVAESATCDRAHVGAVLVKSGHIIATGYNGSLSKMPHCDDVGHDLQDGHCLRTLHAEENALIQAARHGHATDGAICFCTTRPCLACTRRLVAAGIYQIYFKEEYRSMSVADRMRVEEIVHLCDVRIDQIDFVTGVP